jgi:hypothetical protein
LEEAADDELAHIQENRIRFQRGEQNDNKRIWSSGMVWGIERIPWLVDEYVMKSELPERLVPVIERACRRAPRSKEGRQRSGAAA